MTPLNPIPLLLLAVAAPLAAQTVQPADVALARRGIEAGNAAYIAAFKRADGTALSQVYDPKGARLNEGGIVVRGRKAIADDVGKFVARAGPVRVTLETKDLWLVGDTAYETGVWSYTFQPRGHAEQRIGGHYVTLWKRQPDGGWKIWADMGVPGT
jgi:ketosteroid isomerase-like protein